MDKKTLYVNNVPYETQLTGVVETLPPFYQYKVVTSKPLDWQPYSDTRFPLPIPLAKEVAERFQRQTVGPEVEVIFQSHYWKQHPQFCVEGYTNLDYDPRYPDVPVGPHFTFKENTVSVGSLKIAKKKNRWFPVSIEIRGQGFPET